MSRTTTTADTPTTPTTVILLGRPVMVEHPQLVTNAAEILHELDALEPDDRVHARRYLLHVYGMTVGITTPSGTPLERTEQWATDRQTIASAAGILAAKGEDVAADKLLEVARRG